jgi:hypothetical protein
MKLKNREQIILLGIRHFFAYIIHFVKFVAIEGKKKGVR